MFRALSSFQKDGKYDHLSIQNIKLKLQEISRLEFIDYKNNNIIFNNKKRINHRKGNMNNTQNNSTQHSSNKDIIQSFNTGTDTNRTINKDSFQSINQTLHSFHYDINDAHHSTQLYNQNQSSIDSITDKNKSDQTHSIVILNNTQIVKRCLYAWIKYVEFKRSDKTTMIQNWTIALNHWQTARLSSVFHGWQSKLKINKLKDKLDYHIAKSNKHKLSRYINVKDIHFFSLFIHLSRNGKQRTINVQGIRKYVPQATFKQ